jgi:hypothetical protein
MSVPVMASAAQDALSFAAAALAPAVLWALWRAQTASVGVLRIAMIRLVRHAKVLYLTASWFGTLLHEASHAAVLLLSGHGIKDASVRSETGHVTPRRTRNDPWSFLAFLAAAIAPLWIPPALVLLALALLVDPGLLPYHSVGPGWDAATETVRTSLIGTARDVGAAIASLDLAQPSHIAALVLALVAAPGSRPSHVRGSRFHGTRDEGDVAAVRRRIRQQPLVFLLFLAIVYALYFLLVVLVPAPAWYWVPFETLWAVAVTGVLLALGGAALWSVVAWTTYVRPWAAWIGPAVAVFIQVGVRAAQTDAANGAAAADWPIAAINAASVAAWALATGVLLVVLPRRDAIDRAIRGA